VAIVIVTALCVFFLMWLDWRLALFDHG